MKNLAGSSPSVISLLPSDTDSTLNRDAIRASSSLRIRDKSGTLRSASGGTTAVPSIQSTSIRSALLSSTLVRLTR